MIFNSLEFALFLPIVLILYWFVLGRNAKSQNLVLLLSSLFFYGWADWRFLALILLSALCNFYLGIKIADVKKEKRKQLLFWIGVLFNIGILFYFKYFNFFYDSFVDALNFMGGSFGYSALRIIIPIGVSFFTFQTLGYLINVYHEDIEPNRNILVFTTYVTFFPKLLAGPIERAENFFPQVEVKRKFTYELGADGFRQILWGLFKKTVVADNCLTISHHIINNSDNLPGSSLLVGMIIYFIAIYADFSGYSDTAIGISKLFGIRLMKNFAFPFFATNISDYWKRWHISLTSWMMDYVFNPLSFILRRLKKKGLIISIFITFIIVGLWHGPSWTYILFGFMHGCYFVPLILAGTMNFKSTATKTSKMTDLVKMIGLFLLVALTSIVFISDTIPEAFGYYHHIFSASLFKFPRIDSSKFQFLSTILFIAVMLIIEWVQREKEFGLQFSKAEYPYFRWAVYYFIFLSILMFPGSEAQFIYFRF